MCVVIPVCQALGALDAALQQNLTDLTVRAELYFSKGNQLREMNRLEQAFKVLFPSRTLKKTETKSDRCVLMS